MLPFETVPRDNVDAPARKRAGLSKCCCRRLAPRRFRVFVKSSEAKNSPEFDSLCVAGRGLLRGCSAKDAEHAMASAACYASAAGPRQQGSGGESVRS